MYFSYPGSCNFAKCIKIQTQVCCAHGHTCSIPGSVRQETPKLHKHCLAKAQSPQIQHRECRLHAIAKENEVQSREMALPQCLKPLHEMPETPVQIHALYSSLLFHGLLHQPGTHRRRTRGRFQSLVWIRAGTSTFLSRSLGRSPTALLPDGATSHPAWLSSCQEQRRVGVRPKP